MEFYKYHGTGNDFIIVNDMHDPQVEVSRAQIAALCHRHFGIGSDGFILLRPHEEADFLMKFHNPDGSESFCGNGSRCAVQLAHQLGIIGESCSFETTDGRHHAMVEGDAVKVSLHDVAPIREVAGKLFINTGSPHVIQFVEDTDRIAVANDGASIRYEKAFAPGGTNVNYVSLNGGQSIRVRTYERGVENETLSCGSGVTAASLAATIHQYGSPVTVHTLGGTLKVEFTLNKDGRFTNVFLSGPARLVFNGTVDLESLSPTQ